MVFGWRPVPDATPLAADELVRAFDDADCKELDNDESTASPTSVRHACMALEAAHRRLPDRMLYTVA